MRKSVNEILQEMEESGLTLKAQLYVDELVELKERSEGDVFQLICDAYHYGFHRGMESEKRNHK